MPSSSNDQPQYNFFPSRKEKIFKLSFFTVAGFDMNFGICRQCHTRAGFKPTELELGSPQHTRGEAGAPLWQPRKQIKFMLVLSI